MIFDGVKSGEMLDFGGFCRTRYRTQNGGRGVKTSDVPFLASGDLLQNVNHAPSLGENARKCLFYKEFVDRTDMPLLSIEHLF